MFIGEEMGRPGLIQLGKIETPGREVETMTADITRLKDDLGFTPSTQMETGLCRCIDWWRAQPP